MRRWVRNLLIVALLVLPVVIVSLSYLEDIAETNGQTGTEGVVSLVTNLPKNAIALASEAGYVGIFMLMLMEAAASHSERDNPAIRRVPSLPRKLGVLRRVVHCDSRCSPRLIRRLLLGLEAWPPTLNEQVTNPIRRRGTS